MCPAHESLHAVVHDLFFEGAGPSAGASTSAAPAAPQEDSDDDDIQLLSDGEGDADDLQIVGEQPATAADGAANGTHAAGTSAPDRDGEVHEAMEAARPTDSATAAVAAAGTSAGSAQGLTKRKREDDGDDAAALKRQALSLAGVAEQPPGLD